MSEGSKQRASVVARNERYRGGHLVFSELEYRDDAGKLRRWESVDRCGNGGAVCMIARIVPDDELILVRQFRPPAGRPVIEFPAGLVEPGEAIETAAERELYEETGFRGRIVFSLPPGYSSPGLTGEPVALVGMEISGADYSRGLPEAHPDDGESIEVFRVRADKLPEFLAARESAGDGIDNKLFVLAAWAQLAGASEREDNR